MTELSEIEKDNCRSISKRGLLSLAGVLLLFFGILIVYTQFTTGDRLALVIGALLFVIGFASILIDTPFVAP
ncbi:MAG: hypothetical protein PHG23_02060 [Candidatus Pacebacteria bacterium]|nr:hypothetical protein [Candidatus Paceibacterota bacterium]